MTRDLQVWGVPIERVHTEAFGPSAIKQVGQGPTPADSPFDVTFERSGTTVQWSQGESSLLELAEENSAVAIDFGCRAGSWWHLRDPIASWFGALPASASTAP